MSPHSLFLAHSCVANATRSLFLCSSASREDSKEETKSNKRQKLDPEGKKEPADAATEEKAEAKETPNSIRIFPSTDPGRYVCNYTYCYSLNKFCSSEGGDGNKFYSLFLHVPPFKLIPEEEQLKFVVDLMQLIEEQVGKASLVSVGCRFLINFVKGRLRKLVKAPLNMCLFKGAFTCFLSLRGTFTSFRLRIFFKGHR